MILYRKIDLYYYNNSFAQMISNKDANYISAAAQQAAESPLQMRHGAVAVCGGRIIARGFNHYHWHSSNSVEGVSCHAECDVLHKLCKLGKRGQKRITIYVTRIGQNGALRESSPCCDCYEKMKFFGIKNIVYTESGLDSCHVNIVKCPVDDYKTNVVTTGQKWYSNTLQVQLALQVVNE